MGRFHGGFHGFKAFVKISALLLFLSGGMAVVSCQDKKGDEGANQPAPTNTPTPILEPGQDGTPEVAKTPVAKKIIDTAGEDHPTPTPCDGRFQVQVEVSQKVFNCATFDYTGLNDEAQKLADEQLAKVKCPKGAPCTTLNSFYTFWAADCFGSDIARVRIKGYAVCASPGQEDGTRKGIPAPTDKSKPSDKITPAPVTIDLTPTSNGSTENSTFGAIDDGDYIVDSGTGKAVRAASGMAFDCPVTALVQYTYKEKDPTNGSAPDYNGAVDRAEAQAALAYAKLSCKGTCKPQGSFKVLLVKWSKGGGYVTVDVYFTLTCK